MQTSISLSRLHFPVTALGPGSRIGIWFQGCSIRCDGCISVDTWKASGPDISVEAMLELMTPWLPEADGVTISGGEPFDQPHALHALLSGLRASLPEGTDILVFSGHAFERLKPQLAIMNGLIDALVTEPFVLDAPQTLALRGSDNQALHMLTPLGRERFAAYQRERSAEDDRLDLMVDDAGTFWMTGIPKRGDLERLRQLLASEGTSIRTSEQRPVPPSR